MPHYRTFDSRSFDFQGIGAAGNNDGAGGPQADETDWDAFWDDMIDWPDEWEEQASTGQAHAGASKVGTVGSDGDILMSFETQPMMDIF